MVAPMGSTKLVTSSSTPKCSSTRSIVTGRVAALELVEKANNCAGDIPFIKKEGLRLVKTQTINRYTPIIIISPKSTQTAYHAKALKRSKLGDSTTRAAKRAKTP